MKCSKKDASPLTLARVIMPHGLALPPPVFSRGSPCSRPGQGAKVGPSEGGGGAGAGADRPAVFPGATSLLPRLGDCRQTWLRGILGQSSPCHAAPRDLSPRDPFLGDSGSCWWEAGSVGLSGAEGPGLRTLRAARSGSGRFPWGSPSCLVPMCPRGPSPDRNQACNPHLRAPDRESNPWPFREGPTL